jgi:hypothetical protein
MKRGPKPQQQYHIGPQSKPAMPDYLTLEARDVWFEELERVVAHGISAEHSTTFATYCSLEAACRALWRQGEVPRGAYLSEKRKLSELLGISGIVGRTTAGRPVDPLDSNADPYGALPKV